MKYQVYLLYMQELFSLDGPCGLEEARGRAKQAREMVQPETGVEIHGLTDEEITFLEEH